MYQTSIDYMKQQGRSLQLVETFMEDRILLGPTIHHIFYYSKLGRPPKKEHSLPTSIFQEPCHVSFRGLIKDANKKNIERKIVLILLFGSLILLDSKSFR